MTELAKTVSQSIAEWALKHIILDGRRFSFEGHEYLRGIYEDPHSHIVLSKAAQIGGTTWAILKAIDGCRNGLNSGYFFPTKTDVTDFSKSRIAPLLAENPSLQRLLTDTDTACLKRLGSGNLYCRGLKSISGLKSIPLDLVVLDELDEADPVAKSFVLERLAHSLHKNFIQLSNPSLPAYGIDEAFEASDQRDWTLKCPACSKEVIAVLEFPRTRGEEVRIILPRKGGGYFLACPACGAELDPSRGFWVPAYPGRSSHGYRISQLFSSRMDLGEILHVYRTTAFLDRFYNLKIGIPWTNLERKLDVGTVLARCRSAPLPDLERPTRFMGVDTGKDLHVVILEEEEERSGVFHLIHAGVYGNYADLDRLMKLYGVEGCVIDGLPEIHATRQFMRRHQLEVYMSFFSPTQHGGYTWDDDKNVVLSNRTEALDASRAAVRDKMITLPPADDMIRLFARHMASDAKVLEEDEETGAKSYKYIKIGENHFSFAFTYAWMAATGKPVEPVLEAYRRINAARLKARRENHG